MSVISTIKTDCKDCYKCVRSCPMKAIQVSEGQAQIVEERCINDGTCVNICPQKAKKVRRTDLERVQKWLAAGKEVAVSLAPSYPIALENIELCEIIPILRNLGFSYIQETAWAAEHIAREHLALVQSGDIQPLITSCCPVIIELVEKHYSHLIPFLAPILSPMAYHGKVLAEKYDKVVFIGPCIAKKEEMEHVHGGIDAVLTFSELEELIDQADLTPNKETWAEFDGEKPNQARLFPLGGGLLKTADLSTDLLAEEYFTLTGLDEAIELLENFPKNSGIKLIEIMACKGGCIGGVGISKDTSPVLKRQELLRYHREQQEKRLFTRKDDKLENTSGERNFYYRGGVYQIPDEEEIREILLQVGKASPEDELNCGSCGYNSCRDKAIAVYNGLAEVEMCLPYMRARAESFSNLILNSTPNGVVVVDLTMQIVEINPAAEKIFGIQQEKMKGKPISTLMDEVLFQKVAVEKKLITNQVEFSPGKFIRQSIFYEEKHDLIIGVFIDVSREEQQKSELNQMREETFEKAQEVIDKQMRVAQEIAGLLGETTAETKVTLTRLMDLLGKK